MRSARGGSAVVRCALRTIALSVRSTPISMTQRSVCPAVRLWLAVGSASRPEGKSTALNATRVVTSVWRTPACPVTVLMPTANFAKERTSVCSARTAST